MNTNIYTVATHDRHIELPSEVEVFPTKNEAIEFLQAKVEIQKMRNRKFSLKEGPNKLILTSYDDKDNIIEVSEMKLHEIKI